MSCPIAGRREIHLLNIDTTTATNILFLHIINY